MPMLGNIAIMVGTKLGFWSNRWLLYFVASKRDERPRKT